MVLSPTEKTVVILSRISVLNWRLEKFAPGLFVYTVQFTEHGSNETQKKFTRNFESDICGIQE